MNGILNLNKPRGRTSFEIVAAVKKISGQKHVGHAGTLDPIASGVLPVCIGEATRVIEYLMDATKTYVAGIELGASTDTYDAEGSVVKIGDTSSVHLDQIKSALNEFYGTIIQVPPAYSALKIKGKPLYRLARAGIPVVPRERSVTIHEISLLEWDPPVVTIRVVCGKGTYIRSLANDLGEKLGCGAFMKTLIRERYGPFAIKDAITLVQFEEISRSGNLEQSLNPIDTVIANWPEVMLDESDVTRVINGIDIPLPALLLNSKFKIQVPCFCRAYTADSSLAAILKYNEETGLWHPKKVFVH